MRNCKNTQTNLELLKQRKKERKKREEFEHDEVNGNFIVMPFMCMFHFFQQTESINCYEYQGKKKEKSH